MVRIDRFRCMEVFARVVEHGGFTGAGDVLQMSRGRVSSAVQALESHLGVRLLDRTTRSVRLTDDGALFHRHALAVLQRVNELEDALNPAGSVPTGRLRVDVPASIGRHVIAPALPEFFRRYPDVVLELGSSDRTVDPLADGYDCVVRGGDVQDEGLVAHALGALPLITCAAPSYLAARGIPCALEDLQAHRFVNFYAPRDGHLFAFDFRRGGERHQVHAPHAVACNDADTYLAAGLAGLGLLQMPCSRVVRTHLAEGRLVQVLADWEAGSLALTLLYRRTRQLSPNVRAFSDWAAELFADELANLAGHVEPGPGSPWLATLQRPAAR